MRKFKVTLDKNKQSEDIVFDAQEKQFMIVSNEAIIALNFVFRDDLVKGGTHQENFNKSKENIPRKIKHQYLKITRQDPSATLSFKVVLLP
jgi:hypothetical protein